MGDAVPHPEHVPIVGGGFDFLDGACDGTTGDILPSGSRGRGGSSQLSEKRNETPLPRPLDVNCVHGHLVHQTNGVAVIIEHVVHERAEGRALDVIHVR